MYVIDQLLQSTEPIVRYSTLTRLMDKDDNSLEIQSVLPELRHSPLLKSLLSERDTEGKISHHPYSKWRGAHWILACLADLGYPPRDKTLMPMLEQVYDWLFFNHRLRQVITIQGRIRRCASIEGNALFASLALGLVDDRSHQLVERLLSWQWPDGGWNCDKRPEAINSSFMESLIPLRALARYTSITGDPTVKGAVLRAGEIFLKRQLFKRQKDGQIINPDFILLHYPCYWHYDILFALKVMAEAGFIKDNHCQAGLEILLNKELSRGGFPLERSYYRLAKSAKTGRSLVNWKAYTLPGNLAANQFITLDALYVLQAAGILH